MKITTTKELGVDYLMNELRTSETKEDFILSFWLFWAESVTVNSREFQKVIASRPVNSWFLSELNKEECEFLVLASQYPEITGEDKDLLYVKCIYKMLSRFPLPLLAAAKRREKQLQHTKIAGHKVEFSVTNLN